MPNYDVVVDIDDGDELIAKTVNADGPFHAVQKIAKELHAIDVAFRMAGQPVTRRGNGITISVEEIQGIPRSVPA